ncbi:MAG: prenyltransferase/squalene oxidase repeat-containing protein [Promethearchaeota archaeon]
MSRYKYCLRHIIFLCLFLLPLLSGHPLTLFEEAETRLGALSPPNEIQAYQQPLTTSSSYSPYSAIPFRELPAPENAQSLLTFGNLMLIYGDYVNESHQEPVEVWVTFFQNLGFNTTISHINNLTYTSGNDLIIVTPSVGTSDASFGVSQNAAEILSNYSQPLLLLGYGHEVLDRLYGFNPVTHFIPSVERYLWSPLNSSQIFSLPHNIPLSSGRYGLYSQLVHYDAYRKTALPDKAEILGTNFDGSGVQLLWFRKLVNTPFIYYWGINQVENLNIHGKQFCENLIHWLIRPTLQQRLGNTLSNWQLPSNVTEGYWKIQGAGGFGYPLEPSLRFSYYVTNLVESFDLAVNISSFASWLNTCYNPLLGFFEDLASSQLNDRCMTTAMGVLMAKDLNILDQFNQTQISAYLASCQDAISGGFFTEIDAQQTTLAATSFALESLSALDQLSAIDVQAALDFVVACQELNPLDSEYGGFYSSASGSFSASLIDTLHALKALVQLEALDAINQTALLLFLANCEEPIGSSVFDTKYSMDSDEWILGTSCALQILSILGKLPIYNSSASRTYILTNQFPNGGWGRGDLLHDFHNSPDETWYGAQALALTGGLGTTEPTLLEYLTHCLTGWGGATEPVIFGDFLSSVDIILILWQVDGLNFLNLSAFLSYLDNCWSTSRSSFVAHQLPSSIGIDTDSPTPDRIVLETGTFGPLYHYGYSQLMAKLGLNYEPWTTRAFHIRQEIEACQTTASEYTGMLGIHHLYVGHESDLTFRFDTTCWNLLAHQGLGGLPTDLNNASAILAYLTSCLQDNATHQYFQDLAHPIFLPAQWRAADEYLAETWLGLRAYAYLNPSLSGLNGDKLAMFAKQYIHGNASLISVYYATEILYFLVEMGLNPNAFQGPDWSIIHNRLLAAFSYEGLVTEPLLPKGKWIPYLISLGLELVQRMNLLSYLDVSPILHLTQISSPLGTVALGDPFALSATVIETRWGQLPEKIQIQTLLFNTTFLSSCGINPPGSFMLQELIPVNLNALGPQNLTLLAFSPGSIPAYSITSSFCTGWGVLSLNTTFVPGTLVPRSIPLNVTINVGLAGASLPQYPIANGEVVLTLLTTSVTYTASYAGSSQYHVSIPTQNLEPTSHILHVNASVPYCNFHTKTTQIMVIVFDTTLLVENILPETPVLFDPVAIEISLNNESGTKLTGFRVTFNFTRPGDSIPYHSDSLTTNQTGLALGSWTPDKVGQWQISVKFAECEMYNASQTTTMIQVSRRPLACTINILPSSTFFIGNQTNFQIKVSDALNGSLLPNLLVGLYEGEVLLVTASTDMWGEANCQWIAGGSLGYRDLHLMITETSTHDSWVSSSLQVLLRDTTSLSVSSNSTSVYAGDTIFIELTITTGMSLTPNGTAALYWDGVLRQHVTISNGYGEITLTTQYTEITGEHLIIVLFGQLDAPDIYHESQATLLITLQGVILPTLKLTVTPLEIEDILLQPTLQIEVQLSYTNETLSLGLVANLTVQLLSQDTTLLDTFIIKTDSMGIGQLTIMTPQPGIYTITVRFEGQRGFVPCQATTPLLVRNPLNRIGGVDTSLLIWSLIVMIFGVIIGAFLFIRQQKRLNDFLSRIRPSQKTILESSHELLQFLTNQPGETSSTDSLDDD